MTRVAYQQLALNMATAVVTLMAAVVGYMRLREVFWPRATENTSASVISDWRPFAVGGVRVGPATPRVTIVEFTDFQCPFCRVASGDLDDLQQWYGQELTIVYRNFPIHRYAHSAALAAECAARQDAFIKFGHRLFAAQDSIGLKSWASFAAESGVPDTARLTHCMQDSLTEQLVRSDSLAAIRLGVDRTPTFLIDSLMIPGNPGFEQLNTYVKAILRRS